MLMYWMHLSIHVLCACVCAYVCWKVGGEKKKQDLRVRSEDNKFYLMRLEFLLITLSCYLAIYSFYFRQECTKSSVNGLTV